VLEHAQMLTTEVNVEAFTVGTRLRLDSTERVVAATLRATAHGVFEARIDGVSVGEGVLAPGWSSYEWRLPVEHYDVTELVRDGARLEVLVGNGWWRGELGFAKLALNYGETIGFAAELEVTYEGGAVQTIHTGADWEGRTSQVSANSLYNGAHIDATHTPNAVVLIAHDFDRVALIAQGKPPIMRHEVLSPQRLWQSTSGGTLVDFGQNLVGWVRLRVRGPRGSIVTVRHAEVLEGDELATRPLRGARATDTFVLSGGDDVFEPTLTFHGFRYAELTGLPRELDRTAIEAVVVHSRMRRTGHFECSDRRVNRLVENSVWGQKGNFLDLPTDCPQRDERLGWTGDISVYASTACYQFDCNDILHNWLLDLRAETQHAGYVPFVIPNVLKLASKEALGMHAALFGPTAIWGDAAAWVPEALWWAFGDRDRLAEHYPGLVLHLESVLPRLAEAGVWDAGFQFGDWLDPTAPPDRPFEAKADRAVIATACLYRSADFAATAAEVLGFAADRDRWTALAKRTRDAFRKHYLSDDGRIRSDAQSVYALAIHFGLLDPDEQALAGSHLAEMVARGDHRVATGFAGTPYVTWALSATGHTETAYRLLLQDQLPSWLYSVDMGATTIWERWDSLLPDGSVNEGEMTSFNHYAPGAVVDWLYKCVAGIRPAAPGYARIHLEPLPGPGLDWARGSLETPYGTVESGWRRTDEGTIVVHCVVPAAAGADLRLPDGSLRTLTAGAHEFVIEAC
jgi:alpha-L-rhamnosidase